MFSLSTLMEMYAGGPGSGCRGPNCGRPAGTGQGLVYPTHVPVTTPDHVPNVVPTPKPIDTRPWFQRHRPNPKFNPNKVGGYFNHGSLVAKVYTHLAKHPGEWQDMGDFHSLAVTMGGGVHTKAQVVFALRTVKAVGLGTGKWDIEKLGGRFRFVPKGTLAKIPTAPRALKDPTKEEDEEARRKYRLDLVNPNSKDVTPQEYHLLTAEVKENENLGGGVDHARKITFADGSKAQFKLSSSEGIDRDNITHGYLAEREVGAYRVAKIVGMDDMVPASVIRTVDGDRGVLRDWVRGETAANATEPYGGSEDAIGRAAVFDYVVGNEDRHMGNWIVAPGNRLQLIDHGGIFPDGKGKFHDWHLNFAEQADERGLPPPSHFAGPYVDHKKQILDALKELGLPKGSLRGVSARIDNVADKNWLSLEVDGPYGENKKQDVAEAA